MTGGTRLWKVLAGWGGPEPARRTDQSRAQVTWTLIW